MCFIMVAGRNSGVLHRRNSYVFVCVYVCVCVFACAYLGVDGLGLAEEVLGVALGNPRALENVGAGLVDCQIALELCPLDEVEEDRILLPDERGADIPEVKVVPFRHLAALFQRGVEGGG